MRTNRMTPRTRKPDAGFTLPLLGVLDCRTPEERQADEQAGKSWQQVAAEVVAGIAPKLTPKRRRPAPSRN